MYIVIGILAIAIVLVLVLIIINQKGTGQKMQNQIVPEAQIEVQAEGVNWR